MTDSRVKPIGADTETKSSLLLGLAANNDEAWSRFVRIYGPLVYYWCRRRNLQASDAADAAQEVFKAVVKQIADFERRPNAKFRAWLMTLTLSKISDFHEKRAKSGLPPTGGDIDFWSSLASPDDNADDGEYSATERMVMLQAALNLLKNEFHEKHWRAFVLTTVNGWSAKEAAAELGVSENVVFLARNRIRARLRAEMGPLFFGDNPPPPEQ